MKSVTATPHATKVACLFSLLWLIFYLAPLPGGDDWLTIFHASQRLYHGQPLYGVADPYLYANPPHIAFLVFPLSVMGWKLSLALISASSLALCIPLLQRWNKDAIGVKLTLTVLSPPMVYLLLHGQIDLLLLGGVLLPTWAYGLVAIAKPQIALALPLRLDNRRIVVAGLVVAMGMLLSVMLLGNWVAVWWKQGQALTDYPHNLWRGLWPYQVPIGVYLALQGRKLRDEKYLIAASPFLVPYAALSSFIGLWMVGISHLDNRQAVVLWVAFWGVVGLSMQR